MGQRTAILIKKNYREYNEDKSMYDDVCEISLIHHQWGIGKTMPMLFLNQLIEANYSCDRKKEYDFSSTRILKEFTFKPLSDDYPYIDKEVHNISQGDNVDVWDEETRVKLFKKTDNNNGGMIIELTQQYRDDEPKTYGGYYTCKIGFVLGYEETKKPFIQIVDAQTYMNKTWGHREECIKQNDEFYEAFKSICTLFDVEEVKSISKRKARV